jgi:hypothetical protein
MLAGIYRSAAEFEKRYSDSGCSRNTCGCRGRNSIFQDEEKSASLKQLVQAPITLDREVYPVKFYRMSGIEQCPRFE